MPIELVCFLAGTASGLALAVAALALAFLRLTAACDDPYDGTSGFARGAGANGGGRR